jgi:hypothetical protein
MIDREAAIGTHAARIAMTAVAWSPFHYSSLALPSQRKSR